MANRRIGIRIAFGIAVLSLCAGALYSGELVWRAILSDFLGMRPVEECASEIYLRDLQPKVTEAVATFWLAQDRSTSILFYSQEILSRTQAQFTAQEQIDMLAASVVRSTSCHNLEAAHWQVAVSIKERINYFTWKAIESFYQKR